MTKKEADLLVYAIETHKDKMNDFTGSDSSWIKGYNQAVKMCIKKIRNCIDTEIEDDNR